MRTVDGVRETARLEHGVAEETLAKFKFQEDFRIDLKVDPAAQGRNQALRHAQMQNARPCDRIGGRRRQAEPGRADDDLRLAIA